MLEETYLFSGRNGYSVEESYYTVLLNRNEEKKGYIKCRRGKMKQHFKRSKRTISPFRLKIMVWETHNTVHWKEVKRRRICEVQERGGVGWRTVHKNKRTISLFRLKIMVWETCDTVHWKDAKRRRICEVQERKNENETTFQKK